jgi:Cathepsin propeptide inhibitor domain (I29)
MFVCSQSDFIALIEMNLSHLLEFCLLLRVVSAVSDVQWEKFKKDYDKSYKSDVEQKRFEAFKENCKKFDDHNEKYERGEFSFKMGVNRDADLTYDEIEVKNAKNEV